MRNEKAVLKLTTIFLLCTIVLVGCGDSSNVGIHEQSKNTKTNKTAVLSAQPISIDQTPIEWGPAGSIGNMRAPSLTVLESGVVLLVGSTGSFPDFSLKSMLYNPLTGQWLGEKQITNTFVPSHTTTLLSSGEVLLTIGGSQSSYIYRPLQNDWVPTGSLNFSSRKRISILTDGSVLVVGFGEGFPISETPRCEIYTPDPDPSKGTWAVVASPLVNRYIGVDKSISSLTLLSGNRVLLAGGNNELGMSLSNCEIYNIGNNSWVETTLLNSPRAGHTTITLTDGRILVTGGYSGGFTPINSCEIYTPDPNPANATWTDVASMEDTRALHTTTLLPMGKILVANGSMGTGGKRASSELYDPATDKWQRTGSLAVERSHHAAVLMTPDASVPNYYRVLIAGGNAFLPDSNIPAPCEHTVPSTFFSVTSDKVNLGSAVTFAFENRSELSPISEYRLDLGDGSSQLSFSTQDTFTHFYATPQTFTVTLTLVDPLGFTNTTSLSVDVSIYFTYTAILTVFNPGVTIRFDFGTPESDLLVSEYSVDVNGDGSYDHTQPTNGTFTWTFYETALEARLSVTDNNGQIGIQTLPLTIRRPVPYVLKPKALCLVYGSTIATAQTMAQNLRDAIFEASGGLVDYQIVDVVQGAPFSGSTTAEQLESIVQNNNIPEQVEAGEVDELFVFASQGAAPMVEAWSYGRGAFYLNGDVLERNDCRMFAAHTFNVSRGINEMLEDLAHRTESTMSRAYGGWIRGKIDGNPWERFTLLDKDAPGNGAVGNAHLAVNADPDLEYDRNNPRYVWSTADDWLNYPNLTGAKLWINADAWRDTGYLQWFFAHIPKADGVGGDQNDGKQNNWWKYIIDYNRYTDLVGTEAINPLPTAELLQAPTIAEAGIPASFSAFGKVHPGYIGSDRVTRLTWYFGDGTSPVQELTHVTQSDPSIVNHVFQSLGTYTVKVVAEDDLGYLGFATTIQVEVRPFIRELELNAIYGTTRGWFGENIDQRVEVVNKSGVEPSPATTLGIYFSQDQVLDPSDTRVDTLIVPSIAPFGSHIASYNAAIPIDWPTRTVYVFAKIDPENLIDEADETNNLLSRKVGLSLLPYDVNGDGSVTITDIFAVSGTFGSVPGDLNWNSSMDVDGDGAITIIDIFAVAGHYGDVDSHVELHASAGPTSGTVPLQVTFNYQAYFFEGSVTKVEIDFGDGAGWQTVATGSAPELNGSTSHWYISVGIYATKIRATDSNDFVDQINSSTITVQ